MCNHGRAEEGEREGGREGKGGKGGKVGGRMVGREGEREGGMKEETWREGVHMSSTSTQKSYMYITCWRATCTVYIIILGIRMPSGACAKSTTGPAVSACQLMIFLIVMDTYVRT